MEKKGNQIKDSYTPALESLLGALDAYNCMSMVCHL